MRIKIYKVAVTLAEVMQNEGEYWSEAPWGGNDRLNKGETLAEAMIDLPDGYSVGLDGLGQASIFDAEDRRSELLGHEPAHVIDGHSGHNMRHVCLDEHKCRVIPGPVPPDTPDVEEAARPYLMHLRLLHAGDHRRRGAPGLSWAELAERLGVAESTLYGWLDGRRSPGRMAQEMIARLYRRHVTHP